MKVYDKKHKQYVNILDVINISLSNDDPSVHSNFWIIFKKARPTIFVNCNCSRENKMYHYQRDDDTIYTAGILTLFNKLVKPNDWFTVPGFLEAYLEFKKRAKRLMVYGVFTPDLLQKQIKKFERKLNYENKLLLELEG